MTDLIESYRIVVFVPQEAAMIFVEKLGPHIPSFLGNYEQVLWWTEEGTEQFREKTPGTVLQQQPSMRVEFSIPKDKAVLKSVIENGIRPNHPWREPVILVFEGKIAAPARK